jgi:hypothetical protein
VAHIAEDLMLLLLDNALAQPSLDAARCDRVLAAAILLDLAHACRIRPAVPGDRVQAGLLLALVSQARPDPVVEPAFALLSQRPLSPAAAIRKLRKDSRQQILTQLERLGLVRRLPPSALKISAVAAWPLLDRERVASARAALLSALFDRTPPTPATAAIVTLLHAVDGLGALLSLNDRGWRWVHARSTEIASGNWVNEHWVNEHWVNEHSGAPTAFPAQPALPEMNLAVTASALRQALA